MEGTRLRFGDKVEESTDTLSAVEQRATVYQRGLSAALAGLPHEKTDDLFYEAGWRQGVRIRALRERRPHPQ